MPREPAYRESGHTADTAVEIYGASLKELFINGVKGLFHTISEDLPEPAGSIPIRGKTYTEDIKINAVSAEDMLVEWLNEYIYRFFTHNLFPAGIDIWKISRRHIGAKVIFVKLNRIPKTAAEVKAAVYHKLDIRQRGNTFSASVIFDV